MHAVTIDSRTRLRAVARLASVYGHQGAAGAVRSLALAAGYEVHGGRIFGRGGTQYRSICRGWQRFFTKLVHGDSDITSLMVERMVAEAIRVGSQIRLDDETCALIKRGAGRES